MYSSPISVQIEPINSENDVRIEEPVSSEKILTPGYILNGLLAGATITVQAVGNRLLDNNSLSSKSVSRSALMFDLACANAQEKFVQGNWEAVDSARKQSLVLVSSVGFAALVDSMAYQIPVNNSNQTFPFGAATTLATINALGFAAAMASSAIMGKPAYTKGPDAENEDKRPSNLQLRRVLSGILTGTAALGSAGINRIIDWDTPLGIAVNLAKTEVLNRLFIAGRKTEKETTDKVKLLAFYWILGLGADVLIGVTVPSNLAFSNPWRYFTGTSLGATLSFLRITANVFLDEQRLKSKAESEEQPESSRDWKTIVTTLATVAIPVFAEVAYQFDLVSGSPTISLAVKMVQSTLGALILREIVKSTDGVMQSLALSAIPAAVASVTELMTNAIYPVNGTQFPVLSVGIGTSSKFGALVIRKWLVGADDS